MASGLARLWGTPPSTGRQLHGVPIRELPNGVGMARWPGVPVEDGGVIRHLPYELRSPPIPILFPSVHRSSEGVRSFTVHPLGTWGIPRTAPGAPLALVPTAPRLMAAALRSLAGSAGPSG
ncbi:MAG: hypothetical protein ACYDFT_05330, partial [Thermoplasmata archaeon]